ncbi:MAG: AEC family transporter, partial [Spirochaetaceae bacterium]|nr:AEC family transporter [Spirochaetaceae bacterium]
MNIVNNTAVLIFGMFVIMIIGLFAAKKGLFTTEGNKTLNSLLLEIVSPILIFTSYQTEFSPSKLNDLLGVIILSFILLILAIIISKIFIRAKGDEKVYLVERMSIMYSNCGYIGMPLMFALFGTDGVFLCAGVITALNIVLWSYGVMMLKGSLDRIDILNIFKSPNMIAIIIGLICYTTNIRLPKLLLSPLTMIASILTPLTMLVIGSTLSRCKIKELFFTPRVYYIVLLHNIILPLFSILLYAFVLKKFIVVSPIVWLVTFIGMSCPVGA